MIDQERAGIRYALVDGVARVTIDRPQVRNAIDPAAHARLNEIWSDIEQDPAVRVVVVSGSGQRSFCAGADMSAAAVDVTPLDFWASLDSNGFGGLSLRNTLEVPVIARVNGFAVGGGLELVLGCDLVVAVEEAEFGLTEPRVGRVPLDGGVTLLVRQVGHRQAMRMLMTGARFSAAHAEQIGLINQVVPSDRLDAAVDALIEECLACAPSSLRAIKQIVNRTGHLSATEARDLRLPAVMAALTSKNADEGVRAFQEKRRPRWTD